MLRSLRILFACSFLIPLASPMIQQACPSGAPIGTFQLTATPPEGGVARPIETVNQLLPKDTIWYEPAALSAADKKKARIALVLVPSDSSKVLVLPPKPAGDPISWTVPSATQIVAVVWGPHGLEDSKVKGLVKKNSDLIGELADYAQKTEQTQNLIQAITQQQQSLLTGENLDTAVVSFASSFPGAPQIDRTQPANQQMLALLRSVNPALSSYDPLAPSAAQRTEQSAGLAAAVAGMYFGNTEVGLAAAGGALLVNMHAIFFPRTEFRSAFAQTPPEHPTETELCGNKMASASRTELAFLWATRIPDASAPALSLPKTEHLPIGVKSSVPLEVKAREWKLAARVQDWRVVSPDGKTSVPVKAQVNTQTKTIALDLDNPKLSSGAWKLMGNWDWAPLGVSGQLELHTFSSFQHARLTPASQDRLIAGAGKVTLDLAGSDFEFVDKLAYKSTEDPFAESSSLPFRLPQPAGSGPQMRLETEIDTGSLNPGRYAFLLAQNDGQTHQVPFQVLPAPPSISNVPIRVNTGLDSQQITLRGKGLDRVRQISAPNAQITLGDAAGGEERAATVKLGPGAKKGDRMTLSLTADGFEEPIPVPGGLVVAGPRPSLGSVRASLPPDLGVSLLPGEIPASSFVSFALTVHNAPGVSGLHLFCADDPRGSRALEVPANGASGSARLRMESSDELFLSFSPETLGDPGCVVVTVVHTAEAGDSLPQQLGRIVRLPGIESFELTDEKSGDTGYIGTLKGRDLEMIEKVGWDAQHGIPVTDIPVAAENNSESLRITVPWPAPGPHAPLYIWLRGESAGRATTAKF